MKSETTKKEFLEEESKASTEADTTTDAESATETSEEAQAVSISEFTSGLNYEYSMEKYKDNMSTAVTFFLCGIGGIVLLVLNWFGVINLISGKDIESIVMYVAFLILFIIFIGIAVYSVKIAMSVKGKIRTEADYTDDIQDWVENNIDIVKVDASYKGDGLPNEIKYFERSAYITKAVKAQFPEAPADLIDSIVDAFIDEKFHSAE